MENKKKMFIFDFGEIIYGEKITYKSKICNFLKIKYTPKYNFWDIKSQKKTIIIEEDGKIYSFLNKNTGGSTRALDVFIHMENTKNRFELVVPKKGDELFIKAINSLYWVKVTDTSFSIEELKAELLKYAT